MKDMKERLQNYGTWIAFFALIPLFSQACGFDMPGNYDALVNALLTLLIALGVVNNPSIGTGYKDE